MSKENIESSRRIWHRFLAGDVPGTLALLDAEVEVHDVPELPGGSVYHGHSGYLEQITKFREAFEQMDYRVLEHIDCGRNVVTVTEATGTATVSGITGTATYAQVETWRDGKVVSIRYFLSKEAALEAAGLRE
jgi:ketosteroid isomerase-like protein